MKSVNFIVAQTIRIFCAMTCLSLIFICGCIFKGKVTINAEEGVAAIAVTKEAATTATTGLLTKSHPYSAAALSLGLITKILLRRRKEKRELA